MNDTTPSTSFWWGQYNLGSNQNKKWCIGPLALIVRCLNGEWQVGYERQENTEVCESSWSTSDTDQPPESLEEYARYIFRETTGLLTITPQLADRAVVTRPLSPFSLIAGEEATIYISSPIWLSLSVGQSNKKLDEIGIQRPSDTWFGPSPREGELCYASSTHCRLSLDELPLRTHRAITPLVIQNQADSTLLVERINLPAPMLPLFSSDDGQLWTPKVTLTREKDGDMAALIIDTLPPEEATGATQLNKPRKSTSGSVLIRAFNAVFS